MDFMTFSSEMTKRGCCTSGKIFCGTYQGRPFHVSFVNGNTNGVTRFQIFMKFDQVIKKTIYKKISIAMQGICKINSPKNTPHLFMNVTIRDNASFSQNFDRLLMTIDQEAKAEGYGIPVTCAVCNQAGSDSFAFYNEQYISVHNACIQKNTQDKVEKIQDNELNANYLLGIIGGIIGGIFGSIPSVLSIVLANVISAWLCALIPLGVYFGYKLFKGKMNRAALFITIVISVLIIPVLHYLVFAFTVSKEYGFYPGLNVYISTISMYPADFMPGLAQIALFIGLGIVIVLSIISRGNRHFHAEANFTWNSMRPIPQEAAPVQPQTQPQAPVQPQTYFKGEDITQ